MRAFALEVPWPAWVAPVRSLFGLFQRTADRAHRGSDTAQHSGLAKQDITGTAECGTRIEGIPRDTRGSACSRRACLGAHARGTARSLGS